MFIYGEDKSRGTSEKLSLFKILIAALGLSSELREWAIQEIEKDLCGLSSPSLGLDITLGEIVSLGFTLLDSI